MTKEQTIKAIDITIADDHIPKKRPAKRKANITVFDESENQLISYYYEDGTDSSHLYDPKDPVAVRKAAEVLAVFFSDSVENCMRFLDLFKQLTPNISVPQNARPQDQCPVCGRFGMSVHKYNDGRCKRTEVRCEVCRFENEY